MVAKENLDLLKAADRTFNHSASVLLYGNAIDDLSFVNDTNLHEKVNDKFVLVSFFNSDTLDNANSDDSFGVFHRKGLKSSERLQNAVRGSHLEGSYVTHLVKGGLLGPIAKNLSLEKDGDLVDNLNTALRDPANRGVLDANLAYFKWECDTIGNPNIVICALGKKTYNMLVDYKDRVGINYNVICLTSPSYVCEGGVDGYKEKVSDELIDGLLDIQM